MTADLPPVGELVQVDDGERKFLAVRRTPAAVFYSVTGRLILGSDDITSWCRVLVVPDTEEMAAMVEDASWDTIRGAAIR